MPINSKCIHCGNLYTIQEEMLGKQTKCRKCGKVFTLQAVETDGTAVPAEEQSPAPKPTASAASLSDEKKTIRVRSGSDRQQPSSSNRTGLPAAFAYAIGIASLLLLLGAVFFLVKWRGAVGVCERLEKELVTTEDEIKVIEDGMEKLEGSLQEMTAAREETGKQLSETDEQLLVALKELSRLKEERVLFADRFDNEFLEGRWEVASGDVRIVDGKLRIKAEGEGSIVCRVRINGNVQIEYDACIIDGGPEGKISDLSCFFASSRENLAGGGYFVGLGSNYNTVHKILRKGEKVAINKEHLLEKGTKYHVRIVKKAGGVSVYYKIYDESGEAGEELLILVYNDPEPFKGDEHFRFGLYTFGCSAEFDNVKITGL